MEDCKSCKYYCSTRCATCSKHANNKQLTVKQIREMDDHDRKFDNKSYGMSEGYDKD